MTREEFVQYAENEINSAMTSQKNRIMNVVERAWSEGKKNAETDSVIELVSRAIEAAQTRTTSTLMTPKMVLCDSVTGNEKPKAYGEYEK